MANKKDKETFRDTVVLATVNAVMAGLTIEEIEEIFKLAKKQVS